MVNRLNCSVDDIYIPTCIQKDISIYEKTDKQVPRTSDIHSDHNRSPNLKSQSTNFQPALQTCTAHSSMPVMTTRNAGNLYPSTTAEKTRSPIQSTLAINADFQTDIMKTHRAIDALTNNNMNLYKSSNLGSQTLLMPTNLSTLASTNHSTNSLPAFQACTDMSSINADTYAAF